MYATCHVDGALAASRHEQAIAAAIERVTQHVEIRDVIVDQQDTVGIFGRRGLGCVHTL
jgi:hypothetical protein